MNSEKPKFLSQPIVKNVFIFRNGDPYYEARRVVINQKRISNFETLLREVTGGIQAPFGAVRNIYTPIGGHKVDRLESLKSGAQYVAAGREKFKRLNYQQIGTRRKWTMHPKQAKPVPQNRIIVSARFLKPIKESCPIFVVANGDVLDPATRLLIHPRMLSQFDRILEMVTEKIGLKILGGVRSLYTYEGHQVTDGNQLESGQLYVAVGRERFKKLPYSDLLFPKTRATWRVNGVKAHSLPPIYRFSNQNGNNTSVVRSSDSGDGDSKNSLPRHIGSKREHLSSVVREISQAKLISLKKKRSRQSMTISISDSADLESKDDDGITEDKSPQDQPTEEKNADDATKAGEGNSKKEGDEEEEEEEEEAPSKDTAEEGISTGKELKEENQETDCVKEREEEKKGNNEKDGDATIGSEEKEEDVEEKVNEEVMDGSKEEKGSIEKREEVEEEVMEEVTNESKEDHTDEEQGSREKEEELKKEAEREVTNESKEDLKDEEQGSREKEEELKKEAKREVTNESKEDLKDGEQGSREKEEELKKEAKREVTNESKEGVKKHEQGSRSSNGDKTLDSKDKEDGNHPSSEDEEDELDKNTEEEKVDKER